MRSGSSPPSPLMQRRLRRAIASAYARYAVSPCDPKEVDEVPQGNRVQCLELPQLLGVGRVRRLAVGDRERGLPSARPDPECRLEPGVATLAEHRRTREAFLGDAV